MPWTTPKTNWQAGDGVRNTDLNRIEENTNYLKTEAGDALAAHVANKQNPHAVTAAQVGLGSVNNTPDAQKSVASAVRLNTARSVVTNLASGNATSFDGTANITPGVTGILGTANGGTGTNSAAGIRQLLFTGASASMAYIAGFDTGYANGLYQTPQQLRTSMGLGNTLGVLPLANGGTGANSAAGARAALGITPFDPTTLNPISIGQLTTAAQEGVAIGIGNAGYYTRATIRSVAIGFLAVAGSKLDGTAAGNNAIAIGDNCRATGDMSIVIGSSGVSEGGFNSGAGFYIGGTAIGPSTQAIGQGTLALGYGAQAYAEQATALGFSAFASTSDNKTIRLGSIDNTRYSSLKSIVGLTITSDQRDKTDIKRVTNALSFINRIEPIQYVNNHRASYLPEEKERSKEEQERYIKYGMCSYDKEAHLAGTKKGSRKRVGVMAQQVQAVLQDMYGTDNYANLIDDNLYDQENVPVGVENQLSANYSGFVPFLIGAVQDLSKENEVLRADIIRLGEALSGAVSRIEALDSKANTSASNINGATTEVEEGII